MCGKEWDSGVLLELLKWGKGYSGSRLDSPHRALALITSSAVKSTVDHGFFARHVVVGTK